MANESEILSADFQAALAEALVARVREPRGELFKNVWSLAKTAEGKARVCEMLKVNAKTMEQFRSWESENPLPALSPSAFLKFHPMADIFPMMSGAELVELATDAKDAGIAHPIVMFEGMILDGRNRYIVTLLLGNEPNIAEFSGADPLEFVIRENILRRQLTPGQRAIAIAQATDIFQREAKARQRLSNKEKAALPKSSLGQARDHQAKAAGVSPRTSENVNRVIRAGVPHLRRAVADGTIAPSTAAAITVLPHDEQERVIAGGNNSVQQAAKELRIKSKASPNLVPPKSIGTPEWSSAPPDVLLKSLVKRCGMGGQDSVRYVMFSSREPGEIATQCDQAIHAKDLADSRTHHLFALVLHLPAPSSRKKVATTPTSRPKARTIRKHEIDRTSGDVIAAADEDDMRAIWAAYHSKDLPRSFAAIEKDRRFRLRFAKGNNARRVVLHYEQILRQRKKGERNG